MDFNFIQRYWIEVMFGAIVAILTWICKKFSNRIKYEKLKYDSLERGLKALLHGQIVRSYHFCMHNGWIDVDDLATFLNMCEEYSNLGGNGAVLHLKESVKKLPIKETYAYTNSI